MKPIESRIVYTEEIHLSPCGKHSPPEVLITDYGMLKNGSYFERYDCEICGKGVYILGMSKLQKRIRKSSILWEKVLVENLSEYREEFGRRIFNSVRDDESVQAVCVLD